MHHEEKKINKSNKKNTFATHTRGPLKLRLPVYRMSPSLLVSVARCGLVCGDLQHWTVPRCQNTALEADDAVVSTALMHATQHSRQTDRCAAAHGNDAC